MADNAVGFTWHAMDRIVNRLGNIVTYMEVQSALQQASLNNGEHRVTVKRLPRAVKVSDPELLNGYAQGDVIVAQVTVQDNGTSVWVKTVMLVDQHSKYR